jgi:17beta-estradiol 17-dehydrogenase / very-long-chain 3-oxoacyl-CoA reductase
MFCEIFGRILIIFLIFLITIKLLKLIWTSFLANRLGFGIEWSALQANVWAVITGSTDGIGLQYAKQFAQKGYNLLLISRSFDKLLKVKQQIEQSYRNCGQIRVLAIDFTQTEDNIYEKIEEELKQLEEIDVLINNVGICYPFPQFFTELENCEKLINDLISVNIYSCVRLIWMVLPKMEVRGRGIIINISSYSALFPMPLLSLYSATKVFVNNFSIALNFEYIEKGIQIQSVLPFYVSTNMTKNIKNNLMIPSAQQYVRSALKTVGIEKQTFGYFVHKVIAFFQSLVCDSFNMRFVFNHFREIRRRFYANEDLNRFNFQFFFPIKH